MAKKTVTPEVQMIKVGTSIRIFNGKIWINSKPTQKELKVCGNFTLYGIFKFQYPIKGVAHVCQVDFSELV